MPTQYAAALSGGSGKFSYKYFSPWSALSITTLTASLDGAVLVTSDRGGDRGPARHVTGLDGSRDPVRRRTHRAAPRAAQRAKVGASPRVSSPDTHRQADRQTHNRQTGRWIEALGHVQPASGCLICDRIDMVFTGEMSIGGSTVKS